MKQEYTSFELMKYFNISRGSWYKLKNDLNLDNYSDKVLYGKKEKFVYNQDAFNILNSYFSSNEDKSHLLIVQVQQKQIEELKALSTTFQKYYEEEKEKKEDLLILTEDLKNNITNLEKQIEKLKNRSLIERILNKFDI